MKNKSQFFTLLTAIALFSLALTSCSKAPQTEIDNANAAIEAARTAGADVYLPENFIALQDSLNAILADIEATGSKFIKNYSDAKEGLTSVTQQANDLVAQTATRREEVKAEIQTTITDVKALVEEDKQLITKAPRGKEGTTAVNAIRQELAAVETSVAEAEAAGQTDDMAVLDKVIAAKDKATSIKTELEGVIAKYNAAK